MPYHYGKGSHSKGNEKKAKEEKQNEKEKVIGQSSIY